MFKRKSDDIVIKGAGETSEKIEKVVKIDGNKSPESAQHIKDAQGGGHPSVLTVDRPNTKKRRSESLKGVKTQNGKDRDEYPPAVFNEGGSVASVRHISASDKRSADAQLGRQLRGVENGQKVKIVVDPPPPR